jgi:hypothetical protein
MPFLVVEEFVEVAGFGFAQDRALYLVADGSAEYPVSGHEDHPFVVRALGSSRSAGAASLSDAYNCTIVMNFCQTFL